MNPARQSALWTKFEMFNIPRTVTQRTCSKRSENRQRTERVHVRLSPSEQETLTNTAGLLGITVAELIRSVAMRYAQANEHVLTSHRESDARRLTDAPERSHDVNNRS